MYVKEVTVENQVGLHARPATFFIQKANEFKSSIWVEKEERRVNAKSLLGVLSLGIVGGTTIRSSRTAPMSSRLSRALSSWSTPASASKDLEQVRRCLRYLSAGRRLFLSNIRCAALQGRGVSADDQTGAL